MEFGRKPQLEQEKMGDNDGSSNAAQSAQQTTNGKPAGGVMARIAGWFGADDKTAKDEPAADVARAMTSTHGMINLRRLRVEDVAVPRADIISVPDTITKATRLIPRSVLRTSRIWR